MKDTDHGQLEGACGCEWSLLPIWTRRHPSNIVRRVPQANFYPKSRRLSQRSSSVFAEPGSSDDWSQVKYQPKPAVSRPPSESSPKAPSSVIRAPAATSPSPSVDTIRLDSISEPSIDKETPKLADDYYVNPASLKHLSSYDPAPSSTGRREGSSSKSKTATGTTSSKSTSGSGKSARFSLISLFRKSAVEEKSISSSSMAPVTRADLRNEPSSGKLVRIPRKGRGKKSSEKAAVEKRSISPKSSSAPLANPVADYELTAWETDTDSIDTVVQEVRPPEPWC